jgi:hypothetical protein
VPARSSFDYAVIRVVPRVEREEFINVGVVLFCLQADFLGALIELDEERLLALSPGADLPAIRRHLETIPKICAGDIEAGEIGKLSQRERFHWLVAPRSTAIQMSAVHSGICEEPSGALLHMLAHMVRQPT